MTLSGKLQVYPYGQHLAQKRPKASKYWPKYTLSSKATDTSKRCIVSKRFIFQNSDFFYLKAYYLRLFHAKFHHLLSSSLAWTSIWKILLFPLWSLINRTSIDAKWWNWSKWMFFCLKVWFFVKCCTILRYTYYKRQIFNIKSWWNMKNPKKTIRKPHEFCSFGYFLESVMISCKRALIWVPPQNFSSKRWDAL